MISIDKKVLIIVEGSTDREVINNLIKENNLFDINKIEYFPKDKNKTGISEAIKFIKGLCTYPLVTSKKVDRILIILDADEDLKGRFQEILRALKKQDGELMKFDVDVLPSKCGEFLRNNGKVGIGIFLFPNNLEKGCIETLCLKALKHKELKKFFSCIDSYIDCYCSSCNENINSNHRDKTKFRIYIHTLDPEHFQPVINKEIDYKNTSVFKDLIKFLCGN